MKLLYYTQRFGYHLLPEYVFKNKYKQLKEFEKTADPQLIEDRLNYYFNRTETFEIPKEAVAFKNFKKSRGTDYFLDLKDFLMYFQKDFQFAYHFGDETHINDYPTLFKARPIEGENQNSVIFKLDKTRHFQWVDDSNEYSKKKDLLVWRGGAYKVQTHRTSFVHKYWDHPMCEIGQTNKPVEDVPWQKGFMSIEEQLKYKFILSLEGNDVATNLKWVMSSHSLCLMPKPKYETWFMEGTLKAGEHYVELDKEYTNVEEVMEYYLSHEKEALEIIDNANRYTQKFRNPLLEDLLCIKVLERYAELTGQSKCLKF